LLAILTTLLSATTDLPPAVAQELIAAKRLPDLPERPGVAAPYVGVAGNALILAGGTNFPDAPPWQNGTKTWHDEAYVLTAPNAKWKRGFKLPQRMAYGISLTTKSGILCIGGCNDKTNLDDVFTLQWDGKHLTHKELPRLPRPTSCAAGAIVGTRVYVAGGQAGPDPLSGPSHSYFWSMDLDEVPPQWREEPPWPGPERFFAVAGSDGQFFYLLSGMRRVQVGAEEPRLEFLRDAYRFDIAARTWKKLDGLPNANAAVASPAPLVNGGLLLLGRGADGTGADLPPRDRPAFQGDVRRYDLATGRWSRVGALPFGVAAPGIAQWNGNIIVASGEVSAGVRTTAVWSIRPAAIPSR
jgi:N-acetylneuraminic acid mutarotase